ncbi:MAG: dTMP kinase [Deltaproteobacteria bacterium]|nr:dTMP kinase [Deltaproteobacteria bacterium]MBW2083282.1 dTMP kinase [Deltaproteobacteria bacterium]HDM10120.1 dTMP kinase [Desulfobacteraceae bacterium]
MFITFEGIEGCGKSTQARLLFEAMKARGIDTVLTREPGGTRIGQKIRKILMSTSNTELCAAAELLLLEADRAQHVCEVIVPAIEKGTMVICDRFSDATVAYQGHGRGIDLDFIQKLNSYASNMIRPDKTFLLDCPVELGLTRALDRNMKAERQGEGRFEAETLEFHQEVRNGYMSLAKREPDRFVVLDGTRDQDELAREILGIVEVLLGENP